MPTQTAKRADPQTYLRQALAQDHFALYCQPIADLGKIEAYPMAEILIRMREEEQAMMPPGDFLPVFEHHGMMPELDRWVVSEVVGRLASGSKIPRFTVNLSRQTLADRRFADFFAKEIYTNGIAADSVVFEIDEGDAAAAPEAVKHLTATLQTVGGKMLIDGFGRAANSAALLKLPCIQYVKVHDSLTRNLARDNAATPRLQALLQLAAARKVLAIAECVEDHDVLARLQAMKVGYAQGFGVCAPQSIDRYARRRTSVNLPTA